MSERVAVHHGDCLEVLKGLEADSVDAIVTDPPAGISFMGRHWDGNRGGRDAWIAWMRGVAAECLRVAKPGAHALVWALPRTSHWTATAWEDGGWEVRDRVAFLHAVGFPKSLDVSKAIDRMAGAEREVVGERNQRFGLTQATGWNETSTPRNSTIADTAPATPEAAAWDGWGTALKPAVEDWWLLRKPLAERTVAAQVLATGTGALNVDAARVPCEERPLRVADRGKGQGSVLRGGLDGTLHGSLAAGTTSAGRWPANLAHDGSPEVLAAFAAWCSRPSPWIGNPRGVGAKGGRMFGGAEQRVESKLDYGDTGTAARFFFSAKADTDDRAGSSHPTIKPLALMEWLVRLVCPPGGVVLDPFAGTGVTGEACLRQGFRAVLIEREADYHRDILYRIGRLSGADAPLFSWEAA
jgi:site-specific DNA-methyltransferase (adenine-specific)